MEELSIKEKAKRYDEAIKRAKELLEIGVKDTRDKRVVLSFFPELAESEDERVCGKLIAFLKQCQAVYGDGFKQFDLNIDDAITWLEKQVDKQKLDGTFVNVDDVREDFVQEVYRVLDADSTNDRANQIIDAFDNLPTVAIEKQGEQKPTEWSEEDEMMLHYAIEHFERQKRNCIEGGGRKKAMQEFIDWLKSLKDRVQPKQEWSEEIEGAISLLNDMAEEQEKDYCPHNANDLRKAAQYLETCRPQNTWKPSDEMLEALYRVIPENVMEKSEDEMLLDKLYQGLKYGKVLSEK